MYRNITHKMWQSKDKKAIKNLKIVHRKKPNNKISTYPKSNLGKLRFFSKPYATRSLEEGSNITIWGSALYYPPYYPEINFDFSFYFLRDYFGFDFFTVDDYQKYFDKKIYSSLPVISDDLDKDIKIYQSFFKKWSSFKKLGGYNYAMRQKSVRTSFKDFVMRYTGREKLTLGFDSEWSMISGERNALSYQFHTQIDGYKHDFVFYPDHCALGLFEMLYYIINNHFTSHGFHVLNEGLQHHKNPYYYSTKVLLISHFGGVDYTLCDDYKSLIEYKDLSLAEKKKNLKLKQELYTVENRIKKASSASAYETAIKDKILLEDKIEKLHKKRVHANNLVVSNKHCLYTTSPRIYNHWLTPYKLRCQFNIELRDTMLLSAPGSSLASLGDAIGVQKMDTEKLDVKDGYEVGFYKENMDVLLQNHPQFFEDYACLDSEISYLWYKQVLEYLRDGVTISSVAAQTVRKTVKDYCDENNITWESYDKTVRGYEIKDNVSDYGKFYSSRLEMSDLPDKAYYGGRNECYSHGLVTGTTYDYDLRSAYPFAMQMIRHILFENDLIVFKKGHKLSISDFKHIGQAGFGYVRFKFPDHCKMPCIPLKSSKKGLEGTPVFLLEGEGLVSAPDVYAGLVLGAEVEVLDQGFRLFDVDIEKPHLLGIGVRELVQKRAEMRQQYGKKSVQEMLYKIVCNSIYGKTGQGLHNNTARNIITDAMEDIPQSSITDGVIASTITATVRMTLALIMNFITAKGYKVHSVTTDGFITDYPPEQQNEIDNYLRSITDVYDEVLLNCWGETNSSVLEIKHVNETGFFNIKTRGNIGFDNPTSEYPSVFAGAGYKGDQDYRRMNDDERKAFLLDKILKRNGRLDDVVTDMLSFREVKQKSLKTITKYFNHSEDRFKGLSMDFDKKRKLLERDFSNLKFTVNGQQFKSDYGIFYTDPFKDMDEYEHNASVHTDFINMNHNIKNDEDFIGYELAVKYTMPKPPQKFNDKVYRLTSDELVLRKDAYKQYKVRQFYILLLHHSHLLRYDFLLKWERKAILQQVKDTYNIDTLNTYKNVQKLKGNAPFDYLSACKCADELIDQFKFELELEWSEQQKEEFEVYQELSNNYI